MCTCGLRVIECMMLYGVLLLLFCCVSVCVCSNVCVSFVDYCVVVYVVNGRFVCVCACVSLLGEIVSFV